MINYEHLIVQCVVSLFPLEGSSSTSVLVCLFYCYCYWMPHMLICHRHITYTCIKPNIRLHNRAYLTIHEALESESNTGHWFTWHWAPLLTAEIEYDQQGVSWFGFCSLHHFNTMKQGLSNSWKLFSFLSTSSKLILLNQTTWYSRFHFMADVLFLIVHKCIISVTQKRKDQQNTENNLKETSGGYLNHISKTFT